ncbi:MAG TPA: GreA/GreB family elongation factor [Candidatus Limnocylindrales bacterium]|nr:GreA/GreB family elongation factor [Candidatus Limnocylindrales bacterium]
MATHTAPTEHATAWPSTQEALDRLVDQIARLRADLRSLTGQGIEEGALRLDVATTERRLRRLGAVVARCHVTHDVEAVAIGRAVTVRHADGSTATYRLVAPTDGVPHDGSISADSPLGLAILGARRGDVVEVRTAAGSRSVVVVSVD